jgi:hypothetical protein
MMGTDTFKAFLDKNIYGCKTHEEYIRINGGMEKLKQLRDKELLVGRYN